jgi:hypothetical protein
MGADLEQDPGPGGPAGYRGGVPVVLVAARDEADRIGSTLEALAAAFPGASIWVADDASRDATAEVAREAGATVVTRPKAVGKGGNVTECARQALSGEEEASVFLLCDADLGTSAAELVALVDEVMTGRSDLAVADFSRRVGGGFGLALGFSAWAIRNRCGFEANAPISGQRAITRDALSSVLPFAPVWGMETGMTIDAVRKGFTVKEVRLDLSHRSTGRTAAGFIHRFRQLLSFISTWWSRR